MSTVIAFDTDGTLETSAGPVRVARLQHLDAAGIVCVIVSPSAARPDWYRLANTGPDRAANLAAVRAEYPADLYLYVSDNPGDDALAAAAGFTYVHPRDFR